MIPPVMRSAQVTDVDEIVRLETELFGTDAWSEALVESELTGDFRDYYVVDRAGEILGYAGILTIGAEADVQTVAVSNQIRRHGWGRKLLAQLLNAAVQRKSTQVFLEVRADNHAAQQLYIDLGFVEIGRRTAYYQPDGVDAIVMRLHGAALREAAALYRAKTEETT